ncbi:MAG: tetratricopeptide repeat protein [Alphaproteobacteria bacterium]|nr:tetratricopeptide repeat protein [Alphaproteobacteria bacterium]
MMAEPKRERFNEIMQHYRAGALPEAAEAVRQALTVSPSDLNFLHLDGMIAAARGDHGRAVMQYRLALAQRGDWAEARFNLALSLIAQKQYDEAERTLSALTKLQPQIAQFHETLARTQQMRGDIPAAIAALTEAVKLVPANNEWQGWLALLRRQICDFTEPPETVQLPPAAAIVLCDDPDAQRAGAENYAAQKFSSIKPMPPRSPAAGERIRIGYISSDLHAHATSYLLAGLFALHDRSKFEVFVYSYGIDDGSDIRQRIKDTTEHFTDVSALRAAQVATQIRKDGIDILIDLKGYTRGGRLDILACRPAPVQMHWLGFPGTLGAGFIDYFIADAVTIPPENAGHFREQIIRLPGSYQINDDARPRPEAQPRTAYGLPENALVLGSFNQTYKTTPEIFGLWMEILNELPDAVLWLYESSPHSTRQLQPMMQAAGIDPDRIVTACMAEQAEHLARYHHVDIALDTFPVGGHTTTSDALWMGVPTVTLAGRTFVSRVAASLLTAAGLPELVCGDIAQYHKTILWLARDAAERQRICAHLSGKRDVLPLFDTPRFVHGLERGLETAWRRALDGKPPETFDVPA